MLSTHWDLHMHVVLPAAYALTGKQSMTEVQSAFNMYTFVTYQLWREDSFSGAANPHAIPRLDGLQ